MGLEARSSPLLLSVFLVHMQLSTHGQRRNQLRDHAVAGTATLVLDGADWRATNPSQSPQTINATVPGDILTDLEKAGLIPDPYYNVSWRDPPNVYRWANGTWTFSKTFDYGSVSSSASASSSGSGASASASLVFDGVKMGSRITLNGAEVGITTDQFMRYSFEVAHLLKPTANVLSVSFDPNIDTGGRFMTCTGGCEY